MLRERKWRGVERGEEEKGGKSESGGGRADLMTVEPPALCPAVKNLESVCLLHELLGRVGWTYQSVGFSITRKFSVFFCFGWFVFLKFC